MAEKNKKLRSLGYLLFYIVLTLVVSFLEYKITGYSWERLYVYTFLGGLASEVASLKVNRKEV